MLNPLSACPPPRRRKVNYVSTGAGMFCCYKDTHLDTVPQNSIKVGGHF